MTSFTAIYDLKRAPITFDFGTYLALIDCYRQLKGHHSINLIIKAGAFRKLTPRDLGMPVPEKQWRLKNIILDCCELLPSILDIQVVRSDTDCGQNIDFPENYLKDPASLKRFPYYASDLYPFFNKGAQPRVFKAPEHAFTLIQNITRSPYITLTIRTSRHFSSRNVDLEDWYMFYRYLRESGYTVFVVPDQEDVFSARQFENYDWQAYEPASLDIRIRAALYERALLNICSTNGPTYMMFFSDAPLLAFDQFRGELFKPEDLKKMLGLSPGEIWPWSGPHQRFTWQDSDFKSLVREFKEFKARMRI